MKSILDALEEASPVKIDVTPEGWPIQNKVFAWKLPDTELLSLIDSRPKIAIDSGTTDEERRAITVEYTAWGCKFLSKILSGEDAPGAFDSERGLAIITRLNSTLLNELVNKALEHIEFHGPSDARKKG